MQPKANQAHNLALPIFFVYENIHIYRQSYKTFQYYKKQHAKPF